MHCKPFVVISLPMLPGCACARGKRPFEVLKVPYQCAETNPWLHACQVICIACLHIVVYCVPGALHIGPVQLAEMARTPGLQVWFWLPGVSAGRGHVQAIPQACSRAAFSHPCWRQAVMKPVMGEDDVRSAYVWLQRLACNPYADDDSPAVVHGGLLASHMKHGIHVLCKHHVGMTPQRLCAVQAQKSPILTHLSCKTCYPECLII